MNATLALLDAVKAYGLEWSAPVVLKRNEMLYTAGTIDTNIYYLEEGALRIIHETGNDLNTIRFAYHNSIFASMDSLLTGNPTLYSAEAIKTTTLRQLPYAAFMEFINSDSKHLLLWNQILSYIIIGQLEREIDLLTASPRERYERVLQRSPQLFQQVPHKHIASYLRMAPETLSRLQKS